MHITGIKRITGAALAVVMALSLVACGSSSAAGNQTGSTGVQDGYTSDAESASDGQSALLSDRKIVYTSSMDIECEDAFAVSRTIRADVAAAKGYIETSSRHKDTHTAYIYLTARVPVENYSAFLSNAENYGNVTNQSENSEDITLQYVDVQARITALKAQRDRLVAMEETAVDLDSMLEIEAQLSEVQYQIESYTSQMNAMNEQISYCTIEFSLIQPLVSSPISSFFGDRAAAAFFNGWTVFIEVVQNLLLIIISLSPVILIAAIVIAIVYAVKRYRRKHGLVKPKPAKQQPMYPQNYSYPRPENMAPPAAHTAPHPAQPPQYTEKPIQQPPQK